MGYILRRFAEVVAVEPDVAGLQPGGVQADGLLGVWRLVPVEAALPERGLIGQRGSAGLPRTMREEIVPVRDAPDDGGFVEVIETAVKPPGGVRERRVVPQAQAELAGVAAEPAVDQDKDRVLAGDEEPGGVHGVVGQQLAVEIDADLWEGGPPRCPFGAGAGSNWGVSSIESTWAGVTLKAPRYQESPRGRGEREGG